MHSADFFKSLELVEAKRLTAVQRSAREEARRLQCAHTATRLCML